MELRQLEYFVHVAELGSFTRASNFLSIAQPVLSRQVRALEIEFRQALLERNGRGVTLTEAGKRFLEHGRGVLSQIERAHGGRSGRLDRAPCCGATAECEPYSDGTAGKSLS
jgi:LysR family nitrogen assimilation transcriptional regulator